MWQQWDFGDCWLPFERIQGCKKGIRSSSCGAWLERSIWGLLTWCLWQVFLFIGICWDRHMPRTEKKAPNTYIYHIYIIYIYLCMYTYVDIQWDIKASSVFLEAKTLQGSQLGGKGGKMIRFPFSISASSQDFLCHSSIPWYPRIKTWEKGNVVTAMMTRRLQQCQVLGKRRGHQVDDFGKKFLMD